MAASRKSADAALAEALAGCGSAPDSDGRGAPWAVACSGGLDSTVLLHAAVRVLGAARVLALHVHHGLQPAADDWVTHVRTCCERLGVPLRVLRVADAPPPGASVEAWARERRYALLLGAVRAGAAAGLLTAHHRDDQIETLLMRLARGSGLDGLTGIAPLGSRDGIMLVRPLLALDRADLLHDASMHRLEWVEDPSNQDTGLLRNAVRHRVVPALDAVLPGLRGRIDDTLAQLAQAREVVDAVAADDLRSVIVPSATGRVIDRMRLAALPGARCAHALRAWLAALGAPPPSSRRMTAIRSQLVDGRAARGEVGHAGWWLVRQQERIYAWPVAAHPAPVGTARVAWRDDGIALPDGSRIVGRPQARGLCPDWLRSQPLTLCAAPSSARLRPEAGRAARTLKNLRQEAGLPPRLRDTWPSLAVGDRLLWAAPFGVDRDPDWPACDDGIALHWRPARSDDPRRLFDPDARPGSL